MRSRRYDNDHYIDEEGNILTNEEHYQIQFDAFCEIYTSLDRYDAKRLLNDMRAVYGKPRGQE